MVGWLVDGWTEWSGHKPIRIIGEELDWFLVIIQKDIIARFE